MTERELDWRKFLNKLVYCYGCGRFGLPRKGKPPRNWSLLYQPHAEGPPGLLVCSENCKSKVQLAIQEGPVTEPLEIATNVTMDGEMRDQMMREAMEFACVEEGRLDEMFSAISKEVANDQGEPEEI